MVKSASVLMKKCPQISTTHIWRVNKFNSTMIDLRRGGGGGGGGMKKSSQNLTLVDTMRGKRFGALKLDHPLIMLLSDENMRPPLYYRAK